MAYARLSYLQGSQARYNLFILAGRDQMSGRREGQQRYAKNEVYNV